MKIRTMIGGMIGGVLLVAAFVAGAADAALAPAEAAFAPAAQRVLERVTQGTVHDVRLEEISAEGKRDVYEYEAKGGVLTVRGSSAVAICRGFYDYAKTNGLGMVSWAQGQHFRIPSEWPDAPKTRVVTPYEIRHAYNIVSAGYTFPYWTWERWERELDWQAMHGFNMLMAPTATEAIKQRVWLAAGLTQQEIDEDTCGPAHLPWYRMGNICGIDGPLPQAWHTDQIALQHKILQRMRELGIEPVPQGFNGFVPHAYARIHPEVKLYGTAWNRRSPAKNRPKMMDLADPQFAALTKAYMQAWEKEFGKTKYWLVDSFNEMHVPASARPVTEVLADWGESTWKAIRAAEPDAVWVIQGWTFGYQNWPQANLQALLSKVPDDRMFVLDYANDYYPVWKKYQAFYGKNWACGYVPNMGGWIQYRGDLKMYASRSADYLKDPARGNLKGFTLEGEGFENNEALYELITDTAWRDQPINVDDWGVQYSKTRYGACPPSIKESWQLLLKGCYRTSASVNPKFAWQRNRPQIDPMFYESARKFLEDADELKGNALYRADAVERAALAIGMRADEWLLLARRAYSVGNMELFERAAARTLEMLTQVDRLMEAHPYQRLERWIDFARSHGDTPELKKYYEANARCIVTYWANGVQNYVARVWGGTVRDYNREWLRREFDGMREKRGVNGEKFMLDFVKQSGLSPFTPCADPVADAKAWLKSALDEPVPVSFQPDSPAAGESETVGQWTPGQITTEWKSLEWNLPADNLEKIQEVRFQYARGSHRLEIKSAEIIADGEVVAKDEHVGFAGRASSTNTYRLRVPADAGGNNNCILRAVVKGGGGTDSYGTVEIILKTKDSKEASTSSRREQDIKTPIAQ